MLPNRAIIYTQKRASQRRHYRQSTIDCTIITPSLYNVITANKNTVKTKHTLNYYTVVILNS